MRLVPLGLVAGDDDVEQVRDRDGSKASWTVARRFAVTIPSRRPSAWSSSSSSIIPSQAASSAWSGLLCSV